MNQVHEDYTLLHFAAEEGREETIKLLLTKGANVNALRKDGITPLHIASEKGNVQIVDHLLKFGACVNSAYTSSYREGYTPLHLATVAGSEEIIRLLLSSNAHINANTKDDLTPLHIAIKKGHEKIVKLLLEHGANVDAQNKNGKTVIYLAVEKGNFEIIEHILKYRPNVNNQISKKSTIYDAVNGSRKERNKVIEILFQYGFQVTLKDANNCRLLHTAVEKGYFEIVKDLLKFGADVNTLSKYKKDYTLLLSATENNQEDVATLLINFGADVNVKDNTQKTPIFYAIANSNLKITNLLLTNRASIKENPELLNIAVYNDCIEIVEVLLQQDIDINFTDEFGRTPLHFTALFLYEDFYRYPKKDVDVQIKENIAKLLLNKGAKVNAQTNDGTTTLHAAIQRGIVKVVETLLEYNANVNSVDKSGATPLHLSAQTKHELTCKILLNKGADVNIKQNDGKTALHIAAQYGNIDAVKALLEYGSDINVLSNCNQTALRFVNDYIRDKTYYGSDSSDSADTDYDDTESYLCAYKIIVKILEHQIVMMKTADLYVSEKNLLDLRNNDRIHDFQSECEEEIKIMKTAKICSNYVSFYDILTKSVNKLANYARNDSIVQVLKSNDYKTKFPIYASMINNNFRKGIERKKLLEQGYKCFYSLFKELPYNCTEKIFNHFNNNELRILIDACEPINVSRD